MSGTRIRGNEIRKFILGAVDSGDVIKKAMQRFDITRQAVHLHINKLISDKKLTKVGNYYELVSEKHSFSYTINQDSSESAVWLRDIKPIVSMLKSNVVDIWRYGFSEMFNNAIDHSAGSNINVKIQQNDAWTKISISDDGIGIFENIKKSFNFLDEREAIFELTKGKLTTNKLKHSGEGIFFTSKMFDEMIIHSKDLYIITNENISWTIFGENNAHRQGGFVDGTIVVLKLSNNSERTTTEIFDKYSDVGSSFDTTIVPVELAQNNDLLISRSQARRVLMRLEKYKRVIFNFNGVSEIGQAFADEIFRVFANENPNIKLEIINANNGVVRMIDRAKNVVL